MSASEASTLQSNTPILGVQSAPGPTKVPILGEGFREPTSNPLRRSADGSDLEEEDDEDDEERQEQDIGGSDAAGTEALQTGKRRPFRLGKKKDGEIRKSKKEVQPLSGVAAGPDGLTIVQPTAQRATQASPPRSSYPYQLPSSPQRNLYSSSPHLASPAGSQIFERNVQESSVGIPSSPAIPSHITIENHIPPALDASSEAITNHDIDPDTVEIVMHSSHQPAAVTVTGIGSSEPTGGNWADDLVAHPDKDDAASNYGALDSADVHRLSFISFSDIVHSEHAEHAGGRDSIHAAGLSSMSSSRVLDRSPSPIRSPVSSQGLGTSPPTSKSASVKGVELSPRVKSLTSPISTHAPLATGGELTIETLSQALKRTGSRDLSGFRSQPMSPTSPDGMSDRAFR